MNVFRAVFHRYVDSYVKVFALQQELSLLKAQVAHLLVCAVTQLLDGALVSLLSLLSYHYYHRDIIIQRKKSPSHKEDTLSNGGGSGSKGRRDSVEGVPW